MPVAAVSYASPASIPRDLARWAAVGYVGRPPTDVAAEPAVLYMPNQASPADQRRVGVVEYFPNQTIPANMRRVCLTQPGAPGIGLTAVYDTFTRADSALTLGSAESGQAYSVLAGTPGIASNRAYPASGNPLVLVEAGVANGLVSLTVAVSDTAAGKEQWIYFRAADANNFWRFGSSVTDLKLQKDVAGSLSTVATVAATVASGDVLSVVLSGASILCYRNGALVTSTTDAQFQASTKHGFGWFGTTTSRLDDFRVSR